MHLSSITQLQCHTHKELSDTNIKRLRLRNSVENTETGNRRVYLNETFSHMEDISWGCDLK
jgi:hypothetical protein